MELEILTQPQPIDFIVAGLLWPVFIFLQRVFNMTNTPQNIIPSAVLTDDMFASDAIIEHEVTLGDGVKRTLYFKQLGAIDFRAHLEAERSPDPKIRKESTARLIAKCLVEPDGRRAMNAARAAQLKPTVSGAIFVAIMEINGIMAAKESESPADPTDGDQDEIIPDDDQDI